MSIFNEFVEGFATGFLQAVSENGMPGLGRKKKGRIDRLCEELNWSVDERGVDFIRLHFRTESRAIRKISVCNGDADVTLFIVSSEAVVHAVPQQVMEYLLARPVQIQFGAWTVTRDQQGNTCFNLIYNAFGAGLTADSFRAICEAMLREAGDFDNKMRSAKLLRLPER